jgi:CD36 family
MLSIQTPVGHFSNESSLHENSIQLYESLTISFDLDLWPNEAEHASHLSLMPEEGIPLEGAIRLQINVLVRPLDFIDILEDVPTMFYPMIWFETTTELPDDMAAQL